MRPRSLPKKPAKKVKKVSYELIDPKSLVGKPIYAELDALVDQYHEELIGARIALAWCTSWEPDVDGRVVLGKCKKASDLDRELVAFDFVIMLRKQTWEDLRVPAAMKRAILDHELCHATVKLDDRGEVVEDERERRVFRTRKHDIEEFACIVRRHGCYKADLEEFAAVLEAASLKSGAFIGPSALQRVLGEAGADLALEAIARWSSDEKREAYEWALLVRGLMRRQGAQALPDSVTTTIVPPAHVAEALREADGDLLAGVLEGKDAAAGR